MANTVRGRAAALAAVCVWACALGVSTAGAERPTGPPQLAAAPSLKGSAKHLHAYPGAWTGARPIHYSYSWSRCNALGAECQPASSGSRSYKPAQGDVGHSFVATVKAVNPEGEAEASSTPSAVIAAAPPKHKGKPAITGQAIDGRLLTVGTGNWKGTPPSSYSFEWQRCGSGGCVRIPGAEQQSYRVQTADIGHKLRAYVTATNSAGSGRAKSRPTAKVVPGSPLNLEGPTISGKVLVGQTLTANSGTWVGTPPIAFTYQWLACEPLGGACREIAGATEQTHTIGAGEAGDGFEVSVRATSSYGTASALSPEVSATEPPVEAPENLVKPLITGLAVTGQTLHVSEGVWSGTSPSYSYQWELCNASGGACSEIEGATANEFTIPDGDAGHTLRAVVTAKNSAGMATATSEPSGEIAGVGPVNTEQPTVSGTATAGQILTASSGKWSGTEPITYQYEWLRCNASGGECTQAAAPSILPLYTVAAADVGHTLRANVIATNVAGKGEAQSEPTANVSGVAPSNSIAPLVLGLDLTGQTLTATEGTWTGTEPISYAFRWQRCGKAGSECADISGADKSTYKLVDADAAHTVRVVVTAKNVAGSTEKESAASGEVLGVGPQNTELPTISGEAKEGQILTASSGKWSGTEPITYQYEWLRCNSEGKSCEQAAGASILPTYSVVAKDVGHRLVAKVIATNIAGTGEAESLPTASVAGIKPSNVLAPTVLGLDIDGQTLTATEGTWTGTEPISYAFRWQRCSKAGTECKDITGATKSTYTLTNEDAAHTVRVVVTAKNVAGSTEKESSASGEVLGVGPSNTEPPKVTGSAIAGQSLSASSGKWTGTEPIVYEYEWLRCNTSGAECVQAATPSLLSSYTVAAADVGHTLRAKVIATNIAGKGSAESAPTATAEGVKPANVLAPTVLGLDIDGQTLTATEGTWTGTEPISYAFRWQRCSKAGTECKDISGASKSTYTLTNEDAAHTVRVVVTAKNVAGSTEKESAASGEVLGVGPSNTELPKVTGSPIAGQSLSASSGKWSGTEPITFEYEWLRCNASGAECVQAAAPSLLSSYTVAAADVGHTLRAKVIATNIAGKGSAESAATTTVEGVKPSNTLAPTVLGLDIDGQTLTATEGTWTGTEPISYAFRWQRCSKAGTECKDISGASKSTYTLTNEDAAHTVRVVVTAKNVAGSTEKESAASGEVLGVGPSNTELPKVTGSPIAGQSLSASSGKWSGTEPITFEYEWLRCNASGAECVQAAAPSLLSSYTVAAADVGHTLRAKVIATNIAGKGSAESAPTALAEGVKPSNTLAPTVLGLDIAGQTLTATEGTWTGTEPISYAFRWQRCSKAGSECKDITGATKSTYTLTSEDAGHTVRVVVTAKNVAGSTEKESAASGEVTGVGPSNTELPKISGEAKEGQLLTASSGKWSGTEPITYEYEWLRCNAEGKSCEQAAGSSLLATYSVVAKDVGKTLIVKVTATNLAGKGTAESAKTATVLGVAPTNTVLPVTVPLVSTTSGSTVSVTEGTWTGTQPIGYEVEWKICTTATNCKLESHGEYATHKEFKVPASSGGKKLKVNVIAKNAAGEAAKEALELAILI